MRAAFKEWAVVVDALGRGEQIIILRKGGISEGCGGFKLEHSRFFLFPTRFHQQRESVIESAQSRYDVLAAQFSPDHILRIEYFAEVTSAQELHSLDEARSLRGQHVWRDEVIEERFDWGREQGIYAIAVRVFRLPKPIEMPMLAVYGGCKSWIELEQDASVNGSAPVLGDAEFRDKLQQLRGAVPSAALLSPSPPLKEEVS